MMSSETDWLREQIAKARRREKMALLVIVLGFLLILLGTYAGLIVAKGVEGRYHPYIDQSIFALVFGFLIVAVGCGVNIYYGWKRSEYMKRLTGMVHMSD